MPQWRRVAQSGDIEDGRSLMLELTEEEHVLLVRYGGKLYATANVCPHYGGPLHQGVVRGDVVTCPYHNATFDVTTGASLRGPAMDSLATYEVQEEDDAVFLGARSEPKRPQIISGDGPSVLILGSGAAGISCAETLRSGGFSGRITVLSADPDLPYDRPMLSKGLISGEAPEKYLPLRPAGYYSKLRIDVHTDTNASAVQPEERTVTTDHGRAFTGDLLLLATGGSPRVLDIPGAESSGVFTLRSHKDAAAIIHACEGAANAVVAGASFIGMEVAAQLAVRGLTVTVVEPAPEPLYGALGPEIGRWMRGIHEQNGVSFLLGRKPVAIDGDRRVHTVVLDDDRRIDADLVVVGVGIDPATACLDGTSLDDRQRAGIQVDHHLQTPVAGVYAAGDIARFPSPVGESRVEHWVHAMEQGRFVAEAMMGSEQPYRTVPFFWTRQFGQAVKYAGYPVSAAEIEYDGVVGQGEFLAGFLVDGRLMGIVANGKAPRFVELHERLEAGQSLSRGDFFGVR